MPCEVYQRSSLPLLLLCVAGALAFPVVDWLANSSMLMLSGEAPGSVELWPTQVSNALAHDSSTAVGTRNLSSSQPCVHEMLNRLSVAL
jgi:hypothetical protein